MRPTLYLDTSVPSAYFDERAPDRLHLTREFWSERLSAFKATISELVLQEIDDTPDRVRRSEMRQLVQPLTVLEYTGEAQKLIQQYLKHDVFNEKTIVDATHVAIAVAHRVEYLLSWNFKHLVNVKIRRSVNLVNSLNEYGSIEVIAPPEL